MIRRRTSAGAVSLELVLLAIPLFLIVSLIFAFGRYGQTESLVDQAARDAVRAASTSRSQDEADGRVAAIVDDTLAQGNPSCSTSGRYVMDTMSGDFAASSVFDTGPMNMVQVTVSCDVDMSDLSFIGMGQVHIERTFLSPLDILKGYA